MRIIEKHGMFKERMRVWRPYRVILHHTAGGSISGAESTLKDRGLGYHYMINTNGDVYEYVKPHRFTPHAYKNNLGTVGVAFIGGGKFGAANELQIASCVKLLKHMKNNYPTIREVTGHKHVDPRGWKIDPRFKGEPVDGINWNIDKKYMVAIANMTDLEFISKRRG